MVQRYCTGGDCEVEFAGLEEVIETETQTKGSTFFWAGESSERERRSTSKGHLLPRRLNVIIGGMEVTFNRSQKQGQSQQVLWKK